MHGQREIDLCLRPRWKTVAILVKERGSSLCDSVEETAQVRVPAHDEVGGLFLGSEEVSAPAQESPRLLGSVVPSIECREVLDEQRQAFAHEASIVRRDGALELDG